jgi:hypothetical protein
MFFAVIVTVSCGGSGKTAQDPVCRYPANADTDDGSMAACRAGPPGQICEVSNGATINGADGGVTGGTESCQGLCSAGQYELTCMSSGISGAIPDPAASLSCQIIPLPTPSNTLFYCCPCAN